MSLLNKGTSRMSEGHCGNCDHYHHLKQGKVDCIVDSKLHDTGDSCDDYKTRIPNKSSTVRSDEGLEVKRSREAKAAEDRMRDFKTNLQKDNKKFQIKLVLLAGLIAFITSLITTLIILWLK